MADFTITGALDPRQLLEGLKSFERQVTVTAGRAGEGLSVEFGKKVSSALPSILTKALKGGEATASGTGTAMGSGLLSGFQKQVGAIPTALQKALSGAGSNAGSVGSKIGQSLGQSVGTGLGNSIPTAVSRAIGSSGQGVQREGVRIGQGLGSGASAGLGNTIPTALAKALSSSEGKARAEGGRIGSGLGNAVGGGINATVPPALRRALAAGEPVATSTGLKIGRTMGQGIGSGIDANRALFASVVSQAQKAAQQVGLVFNSVKLRFETKAGEIVSQKELDKLRSLSPTLNAAAGALSQFTGATTQGSAGLSQLSSRFTNASERGGLMQAAITGLSFSLANTFTNAIGSAVGALRGMLGDFMALDSELKLAATAAEETGGYERLRAVVDKVGIEASGTNLEVAKLATSLVRAGYSVKEVEQALPGVVRGAEATGTSFETMGSITGATLRGFGLNVKETSRVVDVLVKTANASNASVEGLGETFKYAAPVANALGISLEDLAATAGLMANAGIDASVAGTGLRFGLTRLQKAASGASGESLNLTKGQEKLTKSMRMLGAEVTKADGTLRPLDEVFIAMKRSLSQLGTASRIELVSAIFGDEAGSKFLALLNQSEASILKMTGTIRNAKGSTDVAREGMQSFGLAVKQLTGSISTLSTSVGDVVSVALAPFVNAANAALSVVVAIPAPIRAAATALGLLAAAYATAKIGAIALGRAMQTDMVSGTITQVQALVRLLRMEFKRDVAFAIAQWKLFQASLSGTNTNAAIAGLGKIAQGLRSLNASQVAAGIQQLSQGALRSLGVNAAGAGKQLSQLVTQGVMQLRFSLGNAAIGASQLGNTLRNMAAASQASETGLKGITLLLQRGMTTGASTAATAATGLSRVFASLAGLTGGALASGFAAAAVAMAPLLIALAAIVPAAIGYNKIMGESRKVTASLGPIVANYGKELDKAGIKYQDLGKSGGPIAEMTRKVGDAFRDSGKFIKESAEKLKQWGPLGALAAGGLKILGAAMMGMPWMQFLRGIQWVIDKTKEAYKEAGRNQAIIEAAEQMEQAEVQFQATSRSVLEFTNKLKGMGTIAPGAMGAVTVELNRNRQAANGTISTFSNLGAQLRLLAKAAQENNNPELARTYLQQAQIADLNVKIATKQLAVLDAEATKRGIVKEKLKEQTDGVALLIEKVSALSKVVNNNANQIEVSQAVLSLGKALADLEQSRFSISRARGQYELEQAEKLGASEGQLARRRQALQVMDAQALHARYQAMLQQQALEVQLLNLSQQKARNEANLSALQARLEVSKAQQALAAAQAKGEQEGIANAMIELQLKRDAVGLADQKVSLLQQMQPIEAAIAQAGREAAVNNMQAEAAGKGWYLAMDGVYRTTQAVAPATAANAQQMSAMSVSAKRAADGTIVISQNTQKAAAPMAQLGTSANQAATAMNGLSVQAYRAADGTIVIRNKAVEASNATKTAAANAGNLGNALVASAGKGIDLEKAITKSGASLGSAANSGSQLSAQLSKGQQAAQGMGNGSQDVASNFQQAAAPAKAVADNVAAGEKNSKGLAEAMDKGQRNTGAAASSAGNLDKAMKGATGLAQTFQKTDLNGMLSRASGSAGGLSSAMAKAASNAQTFYNWLSKASGLPGSRWSGGPVEAGQRYRINELGQEAFLSGGKLSLIRQPRNAVWTAPTAGLVIPAGMTADLKSRGVFSGGGQARATVSGQQMVRGSAADRSDQAALLAQQAIAIGKLQQSVDRLVEKDWSVHVKVRNDAGGSSHLNALNRMR